MNEWIIYLNFLILWLKSGVSIFFYASVAVTLILCHFTYTTKADTFTLSPKISAANVFQKDHWWKGRRWKQNPWVTVFQVKKWHFMAHSSFLESRELFINFFFLSFFAFLRVNGKTKMVALLGQIFSNQQAVLQPSQMNRCNFFFQWSRKTRHNYKHIL